MKYPATHDQLIEAGFKLSSTSPCQGEHCHAMIYWYFTPGGARIPMSLAMDPADPLLKYQPHFADCPDVKSFRRKN